MEIAVPNIMISFRLALPALKKVDRIAEQLKVSRAGLLRSIISRWVELAVSEDIP